MPDRSSLRLFVSPQDVDDDRREASQRHALHQCRCRCCGRFAKERLLQFEAVCDHCIYEDQRPAIRQKVEQARKWWRLTRPQERSPFV
jgi:hypothetical protein